ncbi:MAG: hypothetical protein F9K24_05755 [Leptonema illini]|uniref:SAM-dependent methyltransferase n=1 Tax=Leptonema illini TaxID=183 RepID=A0A833LY71_9LEPT|nr:MAG: hypothetical protein F9K24_05755 [Leptonema illini]
MDTLQLLVDEHRPNHRQGPGDDTETMRALSLAGLDRSRRLKIADIGCGGRRRRDPHARNLWRLLRLRDVCGEVR